MEPHGEKRESGAASNTEVRPKRIRGGLLSDSATVTGLLQPSPFQLRRLWDHDMACAHKFMAMPLRGCKTVEPPTSSGVSLDEDLFTHVLSSITNMWRVMSTVWEIFEEKTHPELGYRLRIKEDLPIKFRMNEADLVVVGWKAVAPEDGPSSHLYQRSMLLSGEYMGGPISFCNWSHPKSCTLRVRQVSHGSGKYHVRAETTSTLRRGQELTWDYGKTEIPLFLNKTWFNPEHCTSLPTTVTRPPVKRKLESEVFSELCVLCGESYRLSSRDSTKRKAQKKVHFINSHVDYLGSDWDGLGAFDGHVYEVSIDRALLEAERLNRVIQRLHSDGWKVVPACTVMTKQERETNPNTVMNDFMQRCRFLKRLGCVVIRGRSSATMVEHLDPIAPSAWNQIWSAEEKPEKRYSMHEADRQENEETLCHDAIQDVMMIINGFSDA